MKGVDSALFDHSPYRNSTSIRADYVARSSEIAEIARLFQGSSPISRSVQTSVTEEAPQLRYLLMGRPLTFFGANNAVLCVLLKGRPQYLSRDTSSPPFGGFRRFTPYRFGPCEFRLNGTAPIPHLWVLAYIFGKSRMPIRIFTSMVIDSMYSRSR